MVSTRVKSRTGVRLVRRLKQFLRPWSVFLKGFIRNPVMVGSIVPSSPMLIQKMLGPVQWSQTRLIVEYGPGIGTFCRPILAQLPRDGALIAIDTNPFFIDFLNKEIRDSRFTAVHGSAADVEAIVRAHGFDAADYVVSGLPFSTLPAGVGAAIAAATHRILRPGGGFLVYQFRQRARDFLAVHFAQIDNGFEWRNIPPCFLFWGWKDKN